MVELQILGHLILFAICMLIPAALAKEGAEFYELIAAVFILFVPLEIIYWICHWIFV